MKNVPPLSSYISSTKCHVWLVVAVLGTEKNIFISTESPVGLPYAECFIPTTRLLNPPEENHKTMKLMALYISVLQTYLHCGCCL